MEKSQIKSSKRSKPTQKQSKSKQKCQSGVKKRKTSQTHEETIVSKINSTNLIQPECFICAQPYNLNRRIPVIACPNDHTFCLNCISLSLKSQKPKCPMCRAIMQPKQLNAQTYHEVLQSYKEKNNHLHRELIEKSLVKLAIKKFSKKHSNIDDFETVPRKGKVIKRESKNEPSLLVLEPEMAEKQIKSFKFVYYPANKVEISFGVCIYDKFTLEMIQNCGFDTKIIQFFLTKRDSLIKVDPKKGMKILVNVDLQRNEIHWFSEKQSAKNKDQEELYLISSEAIEIGKKVGDLGFYPYCVLYNTGDMIEMNK